VVGNGRLLTKASTKARMRTPISSAAIPSSPPSLAAQSTERGEAGWGDAGCCDGAEHYGADFVDDAVSMPIADNVPEDAIAAQDFSWRKPVPPVQPAVADRAGAGTKSAVSTFAAKLQAGRAELSHSVAGGTGMPPAADEAPAVVETLHPAGTFRMESFSQALQQMPKPYSQVSHTSRASSTHGAASAYNSSQGLGRVATARGVAPALDVADPFSRARGNKAGRGGQCSARGTTGRGLKRRAAEAELSQSGDGEDDSDEGLEHGSEDPGGSSFEENEVVAA
jgi:hypothetical protein